ncbi:hypothetical protein L596_030247 [Steinernema carpocapsae]|uniref:Uncharacterized protein n=1 Tax=Steinernema carpocapsae TaxID=34508 RepID=A0A4U5LS65_STECR|nr:hypothetical protein L596_030247 [Steinernema carpocapsae]
MDRKAVESLKEKDLFVHIGDAELKAAFPAENPAIAGLYDEITRKQKHLSKLKILSEKIAEREERADFAGLKINTEQLKARLQAITTENEDNKNELKIKGLDLEKARKDLEAKKKRNAEQKDRLKMLQSVVDKKDKERLEIAGKKDDYEAERATLEAILSDKELALEDLKNCLTADRRTIRDLEAYFKKLTKRVFDKQQEFDKIRIGKLPLNSFSVGKSSLKPQAIVPKPSTKAVEEARKRNLELSAKLDKQLEETSEQASFLEEKWFQLQDQLSDVQNALAFEQAKVNEKNMKRHRIHVAETLGRLEPKPTMYKRYLSAQSIDKKSATARTDQLSKRKDVELKEAKMANEKMDKEIESLKFQIEEARKKRGHPSSPSSGASSTRSHLSLPRLPLSEAEKKTQKLLDEHTQEALRELKKEKQEIENKIAIASTEVQHIEKEIHQMHVKIRKANEYRQDLEKKTQRLEEDLKVEEGKKWDSTEKSREENVAQVEAKMAELEQLLTKREELGKEKSKLLQELDQAKIDENNARNRHKTIKSIKENCVEDAKEYKTLKEKHTSCVQKVDESRQALETVLRLQKAANHQNRTAKDSLTAIRPYFDEYVEYESLKREKKLLNEELKKSRSLCNLSRLNLG